MLQNLHSSAQGVPDAVLRAMFAARKAVFVDLLGWDVPVLDGRFELDQFDNEHATYLVLASASGEHLGSARLLPTTHPHILGDLFANLCDGPLLQGPRIFEITRFCLDRTLNSSERRTVRDTLIHAIVEHAIGTGIDTYVAIAPMGWYRQILAFGWRCIPLGLPQTCDGGAIAALAIEIEPGTPALLTAAGVRSMTARSAVDQRAAA